MAVLVLAEYTGGRLDGSVGKCVGAVRSLGDVDILVVGHGVETVSQSAAQLSGVRRVLCVDDARFAHVGAEVLSAVVGSLSGDYRVFAAPASSFGKNVMPRVAAMLDVMQISDVVAIEGAQRFKRPIYAGNALQTVEATDEKLVLTVRTSVFDAVGSDGAAEVVSVSVDVPSDLRAATFIREEKTVSERPDLGAARVVVSGGRALQSKDKFDEIIIPLADQLGAAIGASRAAVDAGYASNDLQVGQTGQIVAPELYIAIGISGAIQHIAGMKDARTVVAINKDPDAPIFKHSDFGLVGDLFEIVPALREALQQAELQKSA